MATRLTRFVAWAKFREAELAFMFMLTGLHVCWWNMQKNVHPDERNELKAYRSVKKFFFGDPAVAIQTGQRPEDEKTAEA